MVMEFQFKNRDTRHIMPVHVLALLYDTHMVRVEQIILDLGFSWW
jgi:hypothetical protein